MWVLQQQRNGIHIFCKSRHEQLSFWEQLKVSFTVALWDHIALWDQIANSQARQSKKCRTSIISSDILLRSSCMTMRSRLWELFCCPVMS